MDEDNLLAQYQNWLVTSCEGGVTTPCSITRLLTDHLLEEPELHGALRSDAFSLIACSIRQKKGLHSALQDLADAFNLLEQACLHLYFTPWRTEFHTIKTYSGLYVHVLEAAFPKDSIGRVLQRLGYKQEEDGQSFVMAELPPRETLAAIALGFLAAHLECCILLDILSKMSSGEVTGIELIGERRSSCGVASCVRKLQKLSTLPIAKSPSCAETWSSRDGLNLSQPQFNDLYQKPFSQHTRGQCKEKMKTLPLVDEPGNVPTFIETKTYTAGIHLEFSLHDCVFSDLSLEFRCSQCQMQHSAKCSVTGECMSAGHNISQLSVSEKHEVVKEAEKNKYNQHSCLQPGNLPHYRCSLCKHLHYINCEEVALCRAQGHPATMIMLEKDQRLWLQKSAMDLHLILLNIVKQTGEENKN
ncbi:spermatogenesis-associated protein 2-like protein [Xenopus laevis]|uniref:Spermatogenesis-associated protein 2-like protein n=1 Tax=Xenopus laevis TaxID=8355 RepID=A0A8J0U8A9_XENLA|nr:spermatogenesis-associated protein 2-like protein [Xenopus laevis]XP_018096983.1 spermatogenesis-associated protein 2-like protein [Xenopus laevis]OCT57367.1 hypothetical protein XELAEV_18003566mg [Xenopus laevis]